MTDFMNEKERWKEKEEKYMKNYCFSIIYFKINIRKKYIIRFNRYKFWKIITKSINIDRQWVKERELGRKIEWEERERARKYRLTRNWFRDSNFLCFDQSCW